MEYSSLFNFSRTMQVTQEDYDPLLCHEVLHSEGDTNYEATTEEEFDLHRIVPDTDDGMEEVLPPEPERDESTPPRKRQRTTSGKYTLSRSFVFLFLLIFVLTQLTLDLVILVDGPGTGSSPGTTLMALPTLFWRLWGPSNTVGSSNRGPQEPPIFKVFCASLTLVPLARSRTNVPRCIGRWLVLSSSASTIVLRSRLESALQK